MGLLGGGDLFDEDVKDEPLSEEDFKAQAKDRIKKDNHNMSKWLLCLLKKRHLVFITSTTKYFFFRYIVAIDIKIGRGRGFFF